MLPIGKFVEPNYGKLVALIALVIPIYALIYPSYSVPCYYGSNCRLGDAACVSSEYDALSTCERTKTLYAVSLTILAYVISCIFFLAYKLLRNEAYAYYYEQG